MTNRTRLLRRMSGLPENADFKHSLAPTPKPPRAELPVALPAAAGGVASAFTEPLGAPLSIGEVATIIGCSAWTVRYRYLPAGLPHHRLAANRKLIFYRNQVIRWLLSRQQKGGNP
jgi:hypothetical protein